MGDSEDQWFYHVVALVDDKVIDHASNLRMEYGPNGFPLQDAKTYFSRTYFKNNAVFKKIKVKKYLKFKFPTDQDQEEGNDAAYLLGIDRDGLPKYLSKWTKYTKFLKKLGRKRCK